MILMESIQLRALSAEGLSYVAFIMWGHTVLIPPMLTVLIMNVCLILKSAFTTHTEIVFILLWLLSFILLMWHITHVFAYIEPYLHLRNKSQLLMM
jgi:hypothetical protein